MEIKDENDLTI